MYELKKISEQAIPRALEKAERYRLLNEPAEAESICLDVLEIDSGNQRALITLVLALSDQFEERLGATFSRARERVAQIPTEYGREYYGALLCERRARAHLSRNGSDAGVAAYEWLTRALSGFARAIELRKPDNDDAILRWNTCVRLLAETPSLRPDAADSFVPLLE
jgi:hypothetical protein